MDLEATSERVIEGSVSPEIWELHMAAYRWAASFVSGKDVVDFGCGTGYGSSYLAQFAQSVVGIDVDPVVVEYAQQRYGGHNTRFQSVPLPDQSVDVVLSFQVIEHVDPDPYLEAVQKMLRPGGVLLLATPNRDVRLWSWQKPWNRWHLDEYNRSQLHQLLIGRFSELIPWQFVASPGVERSELSRYRRARTLLLPATLPFVPERARLRLLQLASKFGPSAIPSASTEGRVEVVQHAREGLCLAVEARSAWPR